MRPLRLLQRIAERALRSGLAKANDAGTRGGARANGDGRCILIDGYVIGAEGQVERPYDGNVAGTGVFILIDWLFSSDASKALPSFRRRHGFLSRPCMSKLY